MTALFKSQRASDFFLFSAAAIVPALAWVYLPLLSIIALLVIPASLAVLVRRQDLRCGITAVALMAVVLSAATLNPYLALLVVIQTGPLGLLLGLLFKNHVPSGKALVTALAFSLAVALGMFLYSYLITGVSPLALNERQQYVFEQERRLLNQVFGQGGAAGEIDPATLKELLLMIDYVEAAWPVIAVSSVLIWSMVSTFTAFWLTRKAMAGLGHRVPPALPFTRIRLPWYVIWGVIAGLVFLLAGDHAHLKALAMSGKAVLWVMGFILSVIGASVLGFYLQRWKVAWPFKLVTVFILCIYLPLTMGLLVTAGIFDAVWNIRRLTPDGRTPEEEEKK